MVSMPSPAKLERTYSSILNSRSKSLNARLKKRHLNRGRRLADLVELIVLKKENLSSRKKMETAVAQNTMVYVLSKERLMIKSEMES